MKTTAFIILSVIVPSICSAQINYSGGTYSQDFNSLQDGAIFTDYTTMPPGWRVSHGSYVWSNGSTGYSANYGTYCLASAAGDADKALGLVIGSTGQAYFGADIRNTSGTTLTSFTLSYFEEQWVEGAVTSSDQAIPFQYSIGASSLTSGSYIGFASLDMHSIHDGSGTFTALDGNASANRQLITATVSGISWAPNQDLWIRWSGVSLPFNSSHAMAVDDLSFSAVPEPSASLLALCAFALRVYCRRRTLLRPDKALEPTADGAFSLMSTDDIYITGAGHAACRGCG